jgi:hypothetical protein
MKDEHQGYGSYTYECRKQDCWHCEMMGLKPMPKQYIDEDISDFLHKKLTILTNNKRRHQLWKGIEIKIIRDHIVNGSDVVCSLLSHRSKMSVLTRISRMRRDKII